MTQSDLEWPRTAMEIVWMTQYDFRWVKSTSASPFWGLLDLNISIYSDSVTSQRETTILCPSGFLGPPTALNLLGSTGDAGLSQRKSFPAEIETTLNESRLYSFLSSPEPEIDWSNFSENLSQWSQNPYYHLSCTKVEFWIFIYLSEYLRNHNALSITNWSKAWGVLKLLPVCFF